MSGPLPPAPVPTPPRDPALPHLEAAFDGPRLSAAIERGWFAAGGRTVASFTPEWIRYKPGASCIVRGALHTVAFDAAGSGAGTISTWATITLYADGRESIVARPGGRLSRLSDRANVLFGGEAPRFAQLCDIGAVLQIAPLDRKLPRLIKASSPARIARALGIPAGGADDVAVELIRHVPERKAVLALGLAPGAGRTHYAKLHSGRDAERMGARQTALEAFGLPVGALACADARLGLTVVEAVPGRTLREVRDEPTANVDAALAAAVSAFGRLHGLPTEGPLGAGLAHRTGRQEADFVLRAAAYVDSLHPASARPASPIARRIAAALAGIGWRPRLVHGDAYDKQVLLDGDTASLIDFDDLAIGDPALDFGTFAAHYAAWAAETSIQADRAATARAIAVTEAAREAVLSAGVADDPDAARRLALYEAAALVRLAVHPFRRLDPRWPEAVDAIVAAAAARFEAFLASGSRRTATSTARASTGHRARPIEASGTRRPVTSPPPPRPALDTGSPTPTDPALPTLPLALDPSLVTSGLRALGRSGARVRSAEVVRHKIGRRCLVAYRGMDGEDAARRGKRGGRRSDVVAGGEVEPLGDRGDRSPILFGKLYASDRGPRVFAAHAALHAAQRAASLPGAPRLPEPVGFLSGARIVLLGAVPGAPATERLCAGDVGAAARIGRALGALHAAAAELPRRHAPADELAPLAARVDRLAAADARLGRAARAALERLTCLAPGDAEWRSKPIHRDLHPEQILVAADGGIGFVDLDDAALGEPALDVGNLIAHLRLYGLRRPDRADGLRAVTGAFRRAHRAADPSVDPGVVAWCEAAALLRLADVHLASDGVEMARALVLACEGRLSKRSSKGSSKGLHPAPATGSPA